ncbi:MAG: tRNA(5-methylaminomethyl-2-thiouridylate)-methyl transferase [Conexibacter sp.]|nr:tRNA(5-methylaminomethyl-2-thiouridylate)-methyl transferase [Conexibacter sp.]
MDRERFEHHLTYPRSRGHAPPRGASGVAGTRQCGDVIRFTLALDPSGTHVADAGYEVDGCGAAIAAGSAAVELVSGRSLVDAARIGVEEIAQELGGLSPAKLHAAELAADALARALGTAARASAQLAPPAERRTRTLVAMSGGVDSAVAALLSARDGSEVLAVTLELWADEQNDGERSCCSAQAVRVARGLAHRMGIPHLTLDLRHEFRAGVVDPFLAGHADGQTPNPCVSCNGHVRLDAMLELADRLGAQHLATGHYARVVEHDEAAGPLLRVAADPAKDQTYMLAALAPASLARLRFPLGGLVKPEVRAIAAEAALPVASKPDSQDLCFLAGTSRNAFLVRHGEMVEQPGEIVDRRGRVLGRHRGYHGFTVGQRKGLGVSGREPLYVLATDPRHNRVVAGTRAELRTTRVAIRGLRLHRDGARVDGVKLRYHAPPLPARLLDEAAAGSHRRAQLELGEPIDGAAPGQLACLMDGDVVVGWGTIVVDPERLAIAAPEPTSVPVA